MSPSEGRSKADRNKRLFDAVLDGMGFKEAGEAFGIGQVRARQLFLREIRNAGSEIWDEGVRSGVSGAYAAPPLKWIRDNKERVVAAIESDTWRNERRIRRLMAEPAIAENAGAGKWRWVRDAYEDTARITSPAGTQYEISISRLYRLDYSLYALLNDAIDGGYGLISLQRENEALRARDALRDRAEGQSAFDLQAQVEALKAARAADKAGFDVVIRELREEVARLNDRHHNRRVRWADGEVTK